MQTEAVNSLTDELIDRFADAPTLSESAGVVDVRAVAPANPPAAIQRTIVGREYHEAYAESVSFVRVADEWSAKHRGAELASARRILDFGAGWGRIARTLLGLVGPSQLLAADVDPEMIALINQCLPGVNTMTVSPLPPTYLADETIDVVTAFSVFSHLSDEAHRAWAQEFGRIIADGGLAVITVLDAAFFGQLRDAKSALEQGDDSDVTKSLAGLFSDLSVSQAQFESGQHVYAGNGGGDALDGEYYGWAAAPAEYVARTWGAAGFDIVEWVPSGTLFPQALVGLRRRERVAPPEINQDTVLAATPARELATTLARRARGAVGRSAPVSAVRRRLGK